MATAVVAQAAGCGGQVLDGGEGDDALGGGPNGSGATLGGGSVGGIGGGVGAGGTRNSGGRAVTGGSTSTGGRTFTGGRPATGGFVGAGSSTPTGGFNGSGSFQGAGGGPTTDASTICYAQGGVYFPGGGGCFLGSETNDACVRQAAPLTRSCDTRCACRACPSFYSRCLNDGGCQYILACAQVELCRGIDACMAKPSCEFIIKRAGGPSGMGAVYFEQYSKCMDSSGCSCDNL